ncbi:Inactive rhomboid protein 1 [Morus notabilis]|uniref:RHOMBOID-like protein n=1 Tax=Morus notabilis TaxID=981085 RepID=W9RUF0_9ROSA|nr:Inactive rhomboid protein 1 [Morus notabilis]
MERGRPAPAGTVEIKVHPRRGDNIRIGLLYVLSGFGGSLLSALFIQSGISVGASGALFGLLGSMLSELITNWTIYANKLAALITLIVIIVLNLAVGVLPHVDNFAHIGGFVSGFLLGFVFLIRPQFRWISQKYASSGHRVTSVTKHKTYQYALWIISLVLLLLGFILGLIMLLQGVDLNDHCSWCHYLSCVPFSHWSCNSQRGVCEMTQTKTQMNMTCQSNGRSSIFQLPDSNPSQFSPTWMACDWIPHELNPDKSKLSNWDLSQIPCGNTVYEQKTTWD